MNAAEGVAAAPVEAPADTAGVRGLTLGVAGIAAIAVAAETFPALLAPLSPSAAVPLHTLFAIAYVAAVAAMALVAWHAPRGEYRLRAIVVACICAAVGVFDLLHLMTYPGMPDFGTANGTVISFYFSRLARLALPCAFIALALVPAELRLPARLRWSALSATLACIAPLAWYGFVHTADLPPAEPLENGIVRHMTSIRWATVALFMATAAVITRCGGLEGRDARHLMRAALLCAVGEACILLGAGSVNAVNVIGHVAALAGVLAAFAALYGDCVRAPFRDIENGRSGALRDKESAEAVFRAIGDGVLVIAPDTTVTAANPVARHLSGPKGAAIVGLPLAQALESIDDEARGIVIDDVDRCLDGRGAAPHAHSREWRIADGRFAVEHHVSPVRDRQGDIRGAVVVLRDVTERWHMLEELRDSVDYSRSLFDASMDPMIAVDMDGAIVDANSAAEEVTAIERAALVGSRFAERFADPAAAEQALHEVFPDGRVRDLALTVVRPNGGITEVSCNVTPYRDAAGAPCGAFVVARDVTDFRQVQLQLQFQASCDALTALPNRRMFRERIERAMAQSRRNGRFAAILIVDLDDFKDVNDTLGHDIGDELIKGVANRLVHCLRETDTVARIGGDEFGILVDDLARPEDAQPLAGKLLAALAAPFEFEAREVATHCSIGISIFPLDPGDAETLVRNADTAMFRAKDAGKNNFQFFTADMNTAVQRRVDLGNRLRNALQRAEFSVFYQPQVDLASGAVTGVEALLRWTAEGIGPVSPIEFIPIAEDSGLIMPIGNWVLREACRQAASWRARCGRDVSVAVNLSARQFRDDNVVAAVTAALFDSGLPPALLEIELTESLLVRDPVRVAETLAALKDLGVRIAVDDFGTGYSSLSYLKRFPLDYLKVDRSFVGDIPGDRNDEAIVRSVVALAHSLGLKVIAEGVETAAQLEFLRTLGCDEIQGYLVSRPRPPGELLEFFGSGGRPPDLRPPCSSTAP